LISFARPRTISEAKAIQAKLSTKVKITPVMKDPRYIAGVDAAFFDHKIIGVACLYQYPELILTEESSAVADVLFSYIPGYLSFREGPAIMEAVNKLNVRPDVILFDGQGIAHPKRLGIASHIGVLLDIPAIGCAKSRLIGEYKEPRLKKGAWSPLKFHDKVIGAVLRTKDNVRPLFISPGHRANLKDSIEIVLNCISKYRIPDPLRRADFISKKIKRELSVNTV
jgi:deoxyribonuclease V